MRLKILGYDKSAAIYQLPAKKILILLSFCSFVLLLLFSCTTKMVKMVEMPSYEGVDVRKIIADRSVIKRVETSLSIEFERDDNTITGDAALELTDSTMDLRIYSFGFLVAEVKEADGVIKSNPELSRNRSLILVDGLRNGIFWWAIKDYEIEEQDEAYQLRNSRQRILIDKKTMLPRYQAIELDNGRELKIFYERPMHSEGFWYPSMMRIELSRYIVKLQLKDISFTLLEDTISHPARGQ